MQVGVLSPDLFAVHLDELSDQLGSVRVGCTVGNMVVNHLLFSDDICVFSPSTLADPPVGTLGQLPTQTSVAPLFGAHGSRNRDKKYSKINSVLRLVQRQDLRAGLYPTSNRIA